MLTEIASDVDLESTQIMETDTAPPHTEQGSDAPGISVQLFNNSSQTEALNLL